MTDFLVYDVFTDQPFGGNPLAIIPDAVNVPETDLQRIAREFNFSETTFVYPPENPDHTARVRIFTPTMEIPFAGHPTIGTAIALAQTGLGPDMMLELGVGPLSCHATYESAQFTTSIPLEILAHPTIAEVTACLNLAPSDIVSDTHAPVLATLGLPFTITELTDRTTLTAIETDISAFRKGAAIYPGALDFAQFTYCRDGNTVHARMFAPLDNMPEDPATGSAAATLIALLAQLSGQDQTLTIHQGEDMGRPSLIKVKTKGQAVTVSGTARKVMEGRLTL